MNPPFFRASSRTILSAVLRTTKSWLNVARGNEKPTRLPVILSEHNLCETIRKTNKQDLRFYQ